LNNTTFQELKLGYTHFDWQNLLAVPALADSPNYVFPGLTIGQRRNYPQEFFQNTFSARYDLTKSWGRHDTKFGGEYLRWHDTGSWELLSRGEYIFTSIPADINRRVPLDAWDNPSRWDFSGLDATVQRFDQNFGDWTIDIPRPTWAVWFGDTWRVSDSFTVNYGVRWDADRRQRRRRHRHAGTQPCVAPCAACPRRSWGADVRSADRRASRRAAGR
jgi:hypothetical protein